MTIQAEFKPLTEELEDIGEKREIMKMFQNREQGPILEIAKNFKEKKETAKALKSKLEEINREITIMEGQLYELMTENGIEGLKIDGKSLFPQSLYWASIPADLENDGFEQLETLELGSLIKRKVNTQTLSAEMRRRIEEGELIKGEISGLWIFADGPLKGEPAAMKISEVKKIGMRKA